MTSTDPRELLKRVSDDRDLRAALEQGTDPALIATWTAEVTATKAAAEATLRSVAGRPE